MSVAYEPRSFMHEGAYPNIGDDTDNDRDPGADLPEDRFPDPDGLGGFNTAPTMLDRSLLRDESPVVPDAAQQLDLPILKPDTPPSIDETADDQAKASVAVGSNMKSTPPPNTPSGRIKAIPKPEREISKQSDGKYYCTFEGCADEKQMFNRKCEWSKHMDKHERPYRCQVEGCEKLAGFTYSGGLLRHEREVHGKHGGPKTTVNCPHPNCKRHSGKGFSRQENLNEHLRRVHTSDGTATSPPVDDVTVSDNDSEKAVSRKRKRVSISDQDAADQIAELSEQVKRYRQENQELKAQLDRQEQHSITIMAQLAELQDFRHSTIGAPAAPML